MRRFDIEVENGKAYLVGNPEGKYVRHSDAEQAIVAADQAGQVARREHTESDVRCECCGYMTYHREHLGCIRAAQKGNT